MKKKTIQTNFEMYKHVYGHVTILLAKYYE